ncbi:hypothetical protein LCGC14_0535050 [marine sediment metagenome]|uniref:Uncharacterized protein n=1 Tax=marine sediment metagenome TaxID=412755 RepID=A0A0F9SCU6_9ZZZZ
MSRTATVSAPDEMWKMLEGKPFSISKVFQAGIKVVADPDYVKKEVIIESLKERARSLEEKNLSIKRENESNDDFVKRNAKLNSLYGEAKYRISDLEKDVVRLTKLLEEQMKNAD